MKNLLMLILCICTTQTLFAQSDIILMYPTYINNMGVTTDEYADVVRALGNAITQCCEGRYMIRDYQNMKKGVMAIATEKEYKDFLEKMRKNPQLINKKDNDIAGYLTNEKISLVLVTEYSQKNGNYELNISLVNIKNFTTFKQGTVYFTKNDVKYGEKINKLAKKIKDNFLKKEIDCVCDMTQEEVKNEIEKIAKELIDKEFLFTYHKEQDIRKELREAILEILSDPPFAIIYLKLRLNFYLEVIEKNVEDTSENAVRLQRSYISEAICTIKTFIKYAQQAAIPQLRALIRDLEEADKELQKIYSKPIPSSVLGEC